MVGAPGQDSEAGGQAGVRAVRQLLSTAGGPSHLVASGSLPAGWAGGSADG